MRSFASMAVTAVCIVALVEPLVSPQRAVSQANSRSHPPSEAPPAAYEAAVDLAFQEFEAGNYAEARSRFLQAHELFPNARVLRALAKTEYELKNYLAAIAFLEQSLNSTVRPLTAAQRADVERLLGQSRGYVARYTVLTVPEQTSLRVDGVETALGPDRSLVLAVGAHTLEVRATGYQPERRALEVIGRADQVVHFELHPLAPPASVVATQEPLLAPPASEPRQDREPLRKKWWVWTGAAVVAAAGVATAVVLARREPGTEAVSGGNSGVVINVEPAPSARP